MVNHLSHCRKKRETSYKIKSSLSIYNQFAVISKTRPLHSLLLVIQNYQNTNCNKVCQTVVRRVESTGGVVNVLQNCSQISQVLQTRFLSGFECLAVSNFCIVGNPRTSRGLREKNAGLAISHLPFAIPSRGT